MELKKELKEKAYKLDGGYLYRTFKLKYLSCTNYQGARIKLVDCNFEKNVTIGYDYNFNSITEQAIYFLLLQGFEVVGIVSGDKDASIIVCCKWTAQPLKK